MLAAEGQQLLPGCKQRSEQFPAWLLYVILELECQSTTTQEELSSVFVRYGNEWLLTFVYRVFYSTGILWLS